MNAEDDNMDRCWFTFAMQVRIDLYRFVLLRICRILLLADCIASSSFPESEGGKWSSPPLCPEEEEAYNGVEKACEAATEH